MQDGRMIRALRAGRRDALEEIIDVYTPYVSVIVHRILTPALPREDVEETVADVFITLWQRADGLDEHLGTLQGYLAAIARTRALNRLRGSRPETDPLEDVQTAASGAVEDATLERERAALLYDAISALGSPDRELFLMYYYERHTIPEIARALSMRTPAVKSRLARGRRKLQTYLIERGITYEEII